MEGLIALYLIYALWKTTVEAATNIVAAVKGRPVVVGSRSSAEAEEVARYATRGAGTALGMLGWLLAQAFHAGREAADDRYGERIHLAREKRRHVRAERRATRARRHAERRGRTSEPAPAPTPGQDTAGGSGQAPQTCQICRQPGTDRDPLVTNGLVIVHQSHLADDEPHPRCDVCGQRGSADDPLTTSEYGEQVHRSHLPPRCEDCGHRGYAGDPLVIDKDGNRVHASHLQPHCRQCDLPGSSIDPLVTTENGTQVHASHLNPRCAACGQPGTVDDPLVIDADGERVHRSHQRETNPPPPPPGPEPVVVVVAEVIDADGQRVDAVWETPAAASWASLRK